MTRREAKREACFLAVLLLEGDVNQGAISNFAAETHPEWTDDDVVRVEAGIKEVIEELARRGWKEPGDAQ